MPAAGVLGYDSGQLSLNVPLLLQKQTRSPDPSRSLQTQEKDGRTRTSYRSASRPVLQVQGRFARLRDPDLLDFDRRHAFELLPDSLGLVLGRVFLQSLGGVTLAQGDVA